MSKYNFLIGKLLLYEDNHFLTTSIHNDSFFSFISFVQVSLFIRQTIRATKWDGTRVVIDVW